MFELLSKESNLNTLATDSVLIVIANTGLKTIWLLPRTRVEQATVLSVKSQVKYRDKKVDMEKGPIEEEEIHALTEYKSQIVKLLEANKEIRAQSDRELGQRQPQ